MGLGYGIDDLTTSFTGMDSFRTKMVFDYIKRESRDPKKVAKRFDISLTRARNIINFYDERQRQREKSKDVLFVNIM